MNSKEKRQKVSLQFECLYTILRGQYPSDSETVLSLYTCFQIEVLLMLNIAINRNFI